MEFQIEMRRAPLTILFAAILAGEACLAQPGNAPAVNDGNSTAESKPDGLRVFTAGHSLHWYVPDILSELASSYGIEGHVKVGVQRIGVSRTIQHWQRGTEAKQALKTGKVDVFTMSPIQFPDEGIDKFVKLGLEHNPDMKFTVQISWGGPDIDNQDFSFSAFRRRPVREKTPEQIKKLNVKNVKAAEEHSKKINEQYKKQAVLLVPTSAAHEALRIRVYNKHIPGLDRQAELFADNIGHPTAPVQALNAYLHFAVIYGCSPVGLPIPKVLKRARKQEWNDERFNRALQELAWETVIKYPPSGVKVSREEKQQAKQSVQLFPLNDVRLLESPFSNAVEINRRNRSARLGTVPKPAI